MEVSVLSSKKKKWFIIGLLVLIFIAYRTAYPFIREYQEATVTKETQQYLFNKYQEKFVVTDIRKEPLMQKYYLVAARAEDPDINFNVIRSIEKPFDYQDDYIAEKWYWQSSTILKPILDRNIKQSGYSFIINQRFQTEEYKEINEDFIKAQILHPELSQVSLYILYIVHKGEESKYKPKINKLVNDIKKRNIKSLLLTIEFYDLSKYENKDDFEKQLKKIKNPTLFSVLKEKTLLKKYDIKIDNN